MGFKPELELYLKMMGSRVDANCVTDLLIPAWIFIACLKNWMRIFRNILKWFVAWPSVGLLNDLFYCLENMKEEEICKLKLYK